MTRPAGSWSSTALATLAGLCLVVVAAKPANTSLRNDPHVPRLTRGAHSQDLLCQVAAFQSTPLSKRHRERAPACPENGAPTRARIIAVGDDRRRAIMIRSGEGFTAPIGAVQGRTLRFSLAALGTEAPAEVRISLVGATPVDFWQRRITPRDSWVEGEIRWAAEIRPEGLRIEVLPVAGAKQGARIAFAEPRLVRAPEENAATVPNIVLYLIDTLRADHTPLYGYHRNTTPHLLDFAAQSVVFARAYSTAAHTRPAVASTLTGTYPSHHQAYQGRGLARSDASLAERLRAAGWSSWAHVANGNVFASALGFDQGFDVFRSVRGNLGQYARTSVLNRPLRALLQQRSDEPFFLFVHAVDPHSPYDPPTGFAGTFQDPAYRGPIEPKDTRARLLEEKTLNASDVAHVRDLYDEEVLYQDAMFGDFLALLDELNLTERTLVVVAGDHGEEFAERGGWEHGGRLYEEQIRIPLLMRIPGLPQSRGRRVDEAVSLVDIAPTILGLYGIPALPHAQGRDLSRPLGQADLDFPADPIYAEEETRRHPKTLRTLILEGWKLIATERPAPRGGVPTYRLFHLPTDPTERNDRAKSDPHQLERMIDALTQFSARIGKPARSDPHPVAIDERTRRQLHALGYLEEP